MTFPLGKPILAMILVALASGAVVAMRRPAPPADLRVWVFADSHARSYRGDSPGGSAGSLVDLYRQRTSRSVRVELISSRALDTRLVSLLSADSNSRDLPDLVEIEIGSVGKFFRPPVDAVGFLPLDEYLKQSGLKDRIVATRFAPWTKGGVIFGVPQDVHPVTITYRKDLFDAAGIDLSAATTWPAFQQAVLRLRMSRAGASVELPTSAADVLFVMLLQRGVNLLDDRNEVHLTDPKVAHTIALYAQLVAGPGQIGRNSTPGAGLWTRDLVSGDLVAALTPDWRVGELREFAPELSGKLAMMPLPRFDPTDAPTSTWGGTMIGIPRKCRQPDRAWDLLKFLSFSPEALAARRAYTNILSPMTDTWKTTDPHPDAYFGGQDVQSLYASLAPHIPRRYVTPFDTLAGGQLTAVLRRAIEYIRQRGNADGLEDACRTWLAESSAELRDFIDFGKFEP